MTQIKASRCVSLSQLIVRGDFEIFMAFYQQISILFSQASFHELCFEALKTLKWIRFLSNLKKFQSRSQPPLKMLICISIWSNEEIWKKCLIDKKFQRLLVALIGTHALVCVVRESRWKPKKHLRKKNMKMAISCKRY